MVFAFAITAVCQGPKHVDLVSQVRVVALEFFDPFGQMILLFLHCCRGCIGRRFIRLQLVYLFCKRLDRVIPSLSVCSLPASISVESC